MGWLVGPVMNSTPDIFDNKEWDLHEVGWVIVSGGNSTVNSFQNKHWVIFITNQLLFSQPNLFTPIFTQELLSSTCNTDFNAKLVNL